MKETGEQVMSLARQLRDEGWKEGWKEGQLKGERVVKLAIARNLLNRGIDLDLVIQATGLPLNQVEQLKVVK